MKARVERLAFDWVANREIEPKLGEKAAKLCARTMRAEARKNVLTVRGAILGHQIPMVIAGDECLCEWTIGTPLESLISECIYESAMDGLDNVIEMLERKLKSARRLRKRMGTWPVPDEGTEPG